MQEAHVDICTAVVKQDVCGYKKRREIHLRNDLEMLPGGAEQ